MLLMASCAKDEVVSVNRDGDEIAFNVVSNASTRANTASGGVYCNNNLPSTFYVWATTADNDVTYIEGDKVVYRKINTSQADRQTRMRVQQNMGVWANTCLRYWPGDRSLNFYASVNALSDATNEEYDENYKFKWNNGAPQVEIKVPEDVASQKDLLFAVKKEQNKDLNEGLVNLNFRHALSQVVFTAKNPSPHLYVKIEGISIHNVMSQNTFTYPSINTDVNIDGHATSQTGSVLGSLDDPEESTTPTETPTPDENSWGTWGVANTPTAYSIELTTPVIFEKGDPNAASVSLSGPKSYKVGDLDKNVEYDVNAMLLLPQTSTAWDPKTVAQPLGNTTAGTYILVKCLIYNIAGTELDLEGTDGAKDVCVWGKEEADGTYTAKEVAIPVELDWKSGKKYIYNFVFGVTGGYDPEDPDPDKDLVPIDFEITVDEFGMFLTEANQEPQGILQLLG